MSTQNHIEEPARSTPQRWPIIIAFALIWGALMSTEQLSIHLLPASIETFTTSPSLIALILFINPAFGFIAQPLVGILSDKIWTPVGRRAFFLITGAPIVGLCLWYLPEARFLWHLVVLVLVYQFFKTFCGDRIIPCSQTSFRRNSGFSSPARSSPSVNSRP